MPSNPNREFLLELSTLVNKRVKILLSSDKIYTGVLRGIQDTSFNVALSEAESAGVNYFRVFITGSNIVEITLAEEPFNLSGLASELASMFQPQNIKILEEAGIIQVFDRFTVSEEGVKGTGPIAERIQKIFDKYKAQAESG
ncbi:MAG: Lsm family RNA-binding protein [Candidatus Heimdallarchaeota archaeon]|nr:Lsm family RNA-binding protein [Candidatus Heimdallarchaeota archaeon]